MHSSTASNFRPASNEVGRQLKRANSVDSAVNGSGFECPLTVAALFQAAIRQGACWYRDRITVQRQPAAGRHIAVRPLTAQHLLGHQGQEVEHLGGLGGLGGLGVLDTDPTANPAGAVYEYGVTLTPFDQLSRADALADAAAHREYQALSVEDLGRKKLRGGAFIDVKVAFDPHALGVAGYWVWRL